MRQPLALSRVQAENAYMLCAEIGCSIEDIACDEPDADYALDLNSRDFNAWCLRKRASTIELEKYDGDELLTKYKLKLVATECPNFYRFETEAGEAVGFCQLQGKTIVNANVVAVFDSIEEECNDVLIIKGVIEGTGQINAAKTYSAKLQHYKIYGVLRKD